MKKHTGMFTVNRSVSSITDQIVTHYAIATTKAPTDIAIKAALGEYLDMIGITDLAETLDRVSLKLEEIVEFDLPVNKSTARRHTIEVSLIGIGDNCATVCGSILVSLGMSHRDFTITDEYLNSITVDEIENARDINEL